MEENGGEAYLRIDFVGSETGTPFSRQIFRQFCRIVQQWRHQFLLVSDPTLTWLCAFIWLFIFFSLDYQITRVNGYWRPFRNYSINNNCFPFKLDAVSPPALHTHTHMAPPGNDPMRNRFSSGQCGRRTALSWDPASQAFLFCSDLIALCGLTSVERFSVVTVRRMWIPPAIKNYPNTTHHYY